ncbi:hypothetical protein Glove_48g196 [Diversispora epigaea]|uniref:Uncharacterized protein n=1 Tax=Diversispora epigaea TaxID=1348612 RepID=A0A397JKW2_9GLOM|nr:hypothetical protein Glove_48g196 [Diversispora epigaea]
MPNNKYEWDLYEEWENDDNSVAKETKITIIPEYFEEILDNMDNNKWNHHNLVEKIEKLKSGLQE